MKKNKSNPSWVHAHINDPYVKMAQKDGYRARAAYKLKEIDDEYHLIKSGMVVVDLGSTPGSWSQVVREKLAQHGQVNGRIIALDLLEMEPIAGVDFIQGDFREDEVLEQLHVRGYRLAVATGKARAGLNRVLAETGLAALFVDTITADEARSKPDPLMLQYLLDRQQLRADQAIMIGDSEHDMAMAAAIAMPRIGITWGVHDAPRLQQFAPLAVIDDLQSLLQWLP